MTSLRCSPLAQDGDVTLLTAELTTHCRQRLSELPSTPLRHQHHIPVPLEALLPHAWREIPALYICFTLHLTVSDLALWFLYRPQEWQRRSSSICCIQYTDYLVGPPPLPSVFSTWILHRCTPRLAEKPVHTAADPVCSPLCVSQPHTTHTAASRAGLRISWRRTGWRCWDTVPGFSLLTNTLLSWSSLLWRVSGDVRLFFPGLFSGDFLCSVNHDNDAISLR